MIGIDNFTRPGRLRPALQKYLTAPTMKDSSVKSYYESVYEVVRAVPFGRVTTYGAIADFLALGSARMVGWALNNCRGIDDVPAHRVVNRKGELSGRNHFSSPDLMQALLENEGIRVSDGQILNFRDYLWIPAREL